MGKLRFILATPLLFASFGMFAQNSSMPEVKLGSFSNKATTSVQQILGIPKIIILDPTSVIMDFQVTIVNEGKTYGPFKNTGNDLDQKEINILKNVKNGKITIDHIHATQGRNVISPNPVVVNISDK